MQSELVQVTGFLANFNGSAPLQVKTDLTTSYNVSGTGWRMNAWLGGQLVQVHGCWRADQIAPFQSSYSVSQLMAHLRAGKPVTDVVHVGTLEVLAVPFGLQTLTKHLTVDL